MKKFTKLAALVSSLVFSLMFINTASADANPFAQVDQVQTIVGDDGKCGEGKCGDKKGKKEGKCGEGKCGDKKKGKKEGKCGEGKCGGK
ncbi:MAG: hypothetical protein ABJI92_11475 [Kangiellaceae bacterium]